MEAAKIQIHTSWPLTEDDRALLKRMLWESEPDFVEKDELLDALESLACACDSEGFKPNGVFDDACLIIAKARGD